MAMLRLHDSVPGADRNRLHPAIGLLGGFGFIVGTALAVHVVFNALI